MISRSWYLSIIGKVTRHPTVDPGRRSTAERLSTVPKKGMLVLIGCCVVFGGAAPAWPAASAPTKAPEALVSRRYQSVSCDTAARADVGSTGVGANAVLAAVNPGFSTLGERFFPPERRQRITRYQLRNVISNGDQGVATEIPASIVRSNARTCVTNVENISRVTPKTAARITPTDAKHLLQLAVVLAAAYVLFLAAWFWATRTRRSRVGSAARS
jgi:hypothetical protein